MFKLNKEERAWVACGIASVAASILLASYGRHGMQGEEIQMRWGIAVEYMRFMGLGAVVMVLVRNATGPAERGCWPQRLLGIGTACFCGMLFAECAWPNAVLLSKIGWVAPLGGIIMTTSWLAFLLEFIRPNRR